MRLTPNGILSALAAARLRLNAERARSARKSRPFKSRVQDLKSGKMASESAEPVEALSSSM